MSSDPQRVTISYTAIVDVTVYLGTGQVRASVPAILDTSRPETIAVDERSVSPDGLLEPNEVELLADPRVARALELLEQSDWPTQLAERVRAALETPLVEGMH